MLLLLAFGCACVAAIDYGLVTAVGPGIARWVVLIVLIAYVIATGTYEFLRARRRRLRGEGQQPRATNGHAGRLGAIIGVLARNGFLIGQAFIVVGSILGGGVFLAILVRSFLPELDNERWARNAIADQLDEDARIIERNRARQARRQAATQETNEP